MQSARSSFEPGMQFSAGPLLLTGLPGRHRRPCTLRRLEAANHLPPHGNLPHGRRRWTRSCLQVGPTSGATAVTPKLSVRRLHWSAPPYGTVLDSVSFDVRPGQLYGLVGPSGCGKSTVLRALNRLWEPSRGSVLLDGVDVTDIPVQQLRVRVGMVFQNPNLFDGSVEYNVRFGPRLRGQELSQEVIEKLLLRAGLEPSSQLLGRSVGELSGGEAQRVSIARALANAPEVLLMDEPTSSLDPVATRKVEETVCRLQHSEGLTVLLVTHSMQQVERLADFAGLLANGHLVASGPPMELRQSENPLVAQFFTGELD